MAEPGRTSYREGVEKHARRSAENSARWIAPETADDLLAKLTTLHRQTEKHDELLSVYETLHESERRFREMIDALPAAIYTTDAEGRLTHFNPAAARLSGRAPELGTDQWCVTWKLFWPDGTPMRHDECPMAVALKEGRIQDGVEAIAERPDGARFWFIPYPRLLRDENGKVTGGINLLLDITERKKSEQVLRKSEERLEMELAATQQLAEIGAQLAEEGNCDALYQKILDAAIAIMRSDMASMQMLDPERNELRLLATKGFRRESAAFWKCVRVDSKTTCGVALRDAQRAVVPDVDECDFMAGTEDLHFFRLSGIRAMQSTPLVSRSGRLLGMISTHWREPHQPSEHDLQLLDMLARQAADLIERSRTDESLRKSEERLREVAGKLDAEVRERTNELERQNGEMLEQAGHLRTLSNRLMRLQDDERRRIARELHDSVGQDLAALSMCLEGTKRSVNGMPQAAARMLDDACAIVERCSSEIRTLSHLLHPPLLEELGLASAIQWYVEGFASRSKIEVDLQMPPGFKRLDSSVELPLFRVLQECLTNIHRHSESKTATVKVEADEHKVSLEVADRGKGISQRDATLNVGKRMGVGISGMRERLNDLGGTLEIHSTNQGTTVRAAIPLRADARAATP